MMKKLLFLLAISNIYMFSFGQDNANMVVGKHSFIAADENLNTLASTVNKAYEATLNATGSRSSLTEAQSNYDEALANYLSSLEKYALKSNEEINVNLYEEIDLVKELQAKRVVPSGR